ncbi:hypothetical protein LCGC14_1068460 [marine sediment metagenome]|uniref:Uncharacterized protein n=1 Tax=marine sediment metagenome TaxID=412755 RepID=A0A0F9N657_9ZZZZ
MKRDKILLIYAGIKDVLVLPMGILHLGAYLLKFGHNVELIDARFDKFEDSVFVNCLVVGISVLTGQQIEIGLKISKKVKEISPKTKVVWGGVHPTLLPEETVSHENIDVVVKGDGELTFKALVDCFIEKKNIHNVRGICFKDEEGTIINNPEAEYFDLDIIPPLPYSMLKNFDKYESYNIFPFHISRGCPGRCTFCYNNQKKSFKKWRSYSAVRVLKDIERVVLKYNPSALRIVDDQALLNKKLIRSIAQGFIDNNWKFKWIANTTLDCWANYDIETIKLLVKSGLKQLRFGGESGSNKILKIIKKTHELKHFFRALTICNKFNIRVQISFLIGVHNETKYDVKFTLRLIDKLRKNPYNIFFRIFRLNPYPNTEIFNTAVELGFRHPTSLEGWGRYNTTSLKTLPWVSKKRFRKLGLIALISDMIVRNEFSISNAIFVDSLKKGPKFHFSLNLNDLLTQFLYLDAKMRWKLKLFNLAPEWVLMNKIINKQSATLN